MGVTVFSGMIGVTVFGLLLTPLFYLVVRKLTRRARRAPAVPAPCRCCCTLAQRAQPRFKRRSPQMLSRTHMKRLVPLVSALLFVTACAVGPNYHAPDTAPAVLRNAAAAGVLTQDPEAAWWQEFEDPELDGLVRRALAANLDLRMALDRVRAARAVFVEHNYDYAPHVGLQGGYGKSVEQEPGFGLSRITADSDSLGFDASWEIDLFGHVRRSVEAARADLGAERASFRDAEVTVAAEVARNYFELRGAQKRSGGSARKSCKRKADARSDAPPGRSRPRDQSSMCNAVARALRPPRPPSHSSRRANAKVPIGSPCFWASVPGCWMRN